MPIDFPVTARCYPSGPQCLNTLSELLDFVYYYKRYYGHKNWRYYDSFGMQIDSDYLKRICNPPKAKSYRHLPQDDTNPFRKKPIIRCGRHNYRGYKRIKLMNERRAVHAFIADWDKEYGLLPKHRKEHPDPWYEELNIYRHVEKSWKKHRKNQWK